MWSLKGGELSSGEWAILAPPGLPLPGATVELLITGPQNQTLTTTASDASGIAEASWVTKKPKGSQAETPPGLDTIAVTNISGVGIQWDGSPYLASFTLLP